MLSIPFVLSLLSVATAHQIERRAPASESDPFSPTPLHSFNFFFATCGVNMLIPKSLSSQLLSLHNVSRLVVTLRS